MQPKSHSIKKPLISIIIPIYNSEKLLSPCLDSVTNQTYNNLEIILINDGSTDHSSKIIKEYANKDHRIKIIEEKNQGQSAARNQGLKIAKGEYISFIDSDDKVEKTFIEKLLKPYQDGKTSLSVCGMRRDFLNSKHTEYLYLSPIIKKGKNESSKSYILRLLTKDGRLYSSVNKLYKGNLAKEISFDTSLNFAEDTKFVLEYLKKSTGEISFIKEPLYIYNFGSPESTIKKSATIWQNWQISYNYLKSWVGLNPSFQELFWLKIILLRWRISFYRSKIRAKS